MNSLFLGSIVNYFLRFLVMIIAFLFIFLRKFLRLNGIRWALFAYRKWILGRAVGAAWICFLGWSEIVERHLWTRSLGKFCFCISFENGFLYCFGRRLLWFLSLGCSLPCHFLRNKRKLGDRTRIHWCCFDCCYP